MGIDNKLFHLQQQKVYYIASSWGNITLKSVKYTDT